MKANSKTVARLAVVQILYQYALCDHLPSKEQLVEKILAYYSNKALVAEDLGITLEDSFKPNISYLVQLTDSIFNHLMTIDGIITENLSHPWNLANLDHVLLAILRAGVCEIRYYSAVPARVIVNEFTNIASTLLPSHQIGIINSILDKLSTSTVRLLQPQVL